jgi:hypothetical protein
MRELKKDSKNKISTLLLLIIFFLTLWYNIFLAILLLPIIYFVFNNNKVSKILAIIYSGFLMAVNTANYIELNRNDQGDFVAGTDILKLYLLLYVITIFFLIKKKKEVALNQ